MSSDTREAASHCTHYESVNLIIVSKRLVHGTTVLHGEPVAITRASVLETEAFNVAAIASDRKITI